MTDPSTRPPSSLPSLPRSLGLKLIVILFLVILMAIPVMFISFVSFERSSRADDVTREVSELYGGEQQIMGPLIVVPYRERLSSGQIREGDYIISAVQGAVVFDDVSVEEKSRSLYKVPVYSTQGTLSAELPALADVLPADGPAVFDPAAARIVVGLSDVTGLQSDVTLSVGGRTLTFEPFSRSRRFSGRDDLYVPEVEVAMEPTRTKEIFRDEFPASGLTLLSVPAADFIATQGAEVTVDLSLTGAQRLSVLPFARSTTLSMTSNWPHPGFGGRFPPSDRAITDDGFSAQWSVPFLRRGIPAQGRAMEMGGLVRGVGTMQVNFVTPLDPYQTVNRALKYAVMFIGLVFLAYFLMETLLGVRVHPAQYLLIGLAQAVFYLLLLAFSEHVGFTLAFLVSAAATVILTAGYAGAVFGRSLIWKSALVFAGVYGLLFVLMRIQDFALMVGALVSFVAIAATLYLTRNLDWYGGR